MFNGNSPSLADIAAVTGNNKDGWGDGNGWWVLIILFAIFGGWGNGFGGGYGNAGAAFDSGIQHSTILLLSATILRGQYAFYYTRFAAV